MNTKQLLAYAPVTGTCILRDREEIYLEVKISARTPDEPMVFVWRHDDDGNTLSRRAYDFHGPDAAKDLDWTLKMDYDLPPQAMDRLAHDWKMLFDHA